MHFRRYAAFFRPEELDTLTAAGKATWDRLEQELAAATDLTTRERDDIRTDAQCRRIEQLDRDPDKDETQASSGTIHPSPVERRDETLHRQTVPRRPRGRSDPRGAARQRQKRGAS